MADLNDLSQDVSLHDNATNAAATFTTVGSKVLLDVNASSDPTRYQVDTDYDATGDVVTSSADVTLYSYTGAGLIDFVAITCGSSSGWYAIIDIDGVEKFRMTMSDLGSVLGLTDGYTPIWTQNANKQFRWRPEGNAGFTTSFAIKARATGSDVTLTHLALFREAV